MISVPLSIPFPHFLKRAPKVCCTAQIKPYTVLLLPFYLIFERIVSKGRFKKKLVEFSTRRGGGFGLADFPLRKIIAQNTGNGLKCILRQTYFFQFFFFGGGVGGLFTINDHIKLLTSLVRPSGNCSPTRIIQNPFHDM